MDWTASPVQTKVTEKTVKDMENMGKDTAEDMAEDTTDPTVSACSADSEVCV